MLVAIFVVFTGASMQAEANSLSPAALESARKIYLAKCAKCHKFYEPRKYSAAEWDRWLESMSRKSKLKPAQEKLLEAYLEQYRAGTIDVIPK